MRRKKNLRLSPRNTSGTIGVCWHKSRGGWVAFIRHKGKQYQTKAFKDKEEALAHRKALEQCFNICKGEIKLKGVERIRAERKPLAENNLTIVDVGAIQEWSRTLSSKDATEREKRTASRCLSMYTIDQVAVANNIHLVI